MSVGNLLLSSSLRDQADVRNIFGKIYVFTTLGGEEQAGDKACSQDADMRLAGHRPFHSNMVPGAGIYILFPLEWGWNQRKNEQTSPSFSQRS